MAEICPEATLCCRCKVLIAAGAEAVRLRLHPKFDRSPEGRLTFDCWFHEGCLPVEYRRAEQPDRS
jgi:hypothetical protein